MRGLMQKLGQIFECMDAIEFAIPAVLTAVLLVAGPIALIVHFLRAQHYAAAGASAVLWLLAAICSVRDLSRRRFSPVTGVLLGVWLIGTLVIWWKLETL
jgi:hypothetical protein